MKDHKFDHFAFSRLPFTDDIKTAFLDAERKEVLKDMKNFIRRRGFAVLTGSPGTGKTMLLNHFCRELNPNENKIIYIPFSMLKPPDMLKSICVKLDIVPVVSTTKMLGKIQECITAMQPVNPILILDEIQKVTYPTMEIVRLMTNVNFEEKNLFSVIMSGNDEFLQHVRLRIYEPLRQRISCYRRLNPLKRNDVSEYINHQFESAGASHKIMTEQAVSLMHDLTSGIPRIINKFCFAALEYAADDNSEIIDMKHIDRAAELVMPSIPEVNCET